MRAAAEATGIYTTDGMPKRLALGKSLHVQGTARMGSENDGHSVCDGRGRVWGTTNLYLAGGCVIPTATASNPTLFGMALGILTAEELVYRVGR